MIQSFGFWSCLRARLVAIVMTGIFGVLAVHASHVVLSGSGSGRNSVVQSGDVEPVRRADIVDRNGALLATSLISWSLYADPRAVWDAEDIVRELKVVFPDLDKDQTRKRLSDRGRAFVWIRRGLTPRQKQAVFSLGLEGLHFREEYQRVYPGGMLAGHVLGHVDVDERGRGGLELAYQDRLSAGREPLRLTIDMVVQEVLEEELRIAAREFRPSGAAGLIMDVRTGALRAVASWPPIDPHRPEQTREIHINRVFGGVFELGSVFKPLSMAAVLEAGLVSPDEAVDISEPVQIGSYKVEDHHSRGDSLYPWQIIAYSSNVGTVRLADRLGGEGLRQFFERLGLTSRPEMVFPVNARPLVPDRWTRLANATASFGHGLAVSPLSLATAYAAIANGGILYPPRLVESRVPEPIKGRRAMRKQTSQHLIGMLRSVVTEGTARRANSSGYQLAGKTGTAEKPGPDGYQNHRNICSFVGFFPASGPEYVVMILLDEPEANGNSGQTAAFNAVPVSARIVSRTAPILGISPLFSGKEVLEGKRRRYGLAQNGGAL